VLRRMRHRVEVALHLCLSHGELTLRERLLMSGCHVCAVVHIAGVNVSLVLTAGTRRRRGPATQRSCATAMACSARTATPNSFSALERERTSRDKVSSPDNDERWSIPSPFGHMRPSDRSKELRSMCDIHGAESRTKLFRRSVGPDGGPNVLSPTANKSPPDVGFSTSGLGPAATPMSALQNMHVRRGVLLHSCALVRSPEFAWD
jgi:hypothetical protein